MPGYELPWGRDAELAAPSPTTHEKKHSLPVKVAEHVIRFHQQVISPVDGPRSHFFPSSSQYMLLAMQKHGFIEGYLMGCDRLLRENDDAWVYRTILIGDKLYKYDPVN
jgi:putative component of membrane protein insertase Oxa1/YidC/SpoIIIJ protein YidD